MLTVNYAWFQTQPGDRQWKAENLIIHDCDMYIYASFMKLDNVAIVYARLKLIELQR